MEQEKIEVILPYKPLPENLVIGPSHIHGLGLFSNEKGPKNMQLGITHVRHPMFRDGWIRTPLGGFYNHSEKPNCKIIDGHLQDRTNVKILVTLEEVEEGIELTCFYTIWNFAGDKL